MSQIVYVNRLFQKFSFEFQEARHLKHILGIHKFKLLHIHDNFIQSLLFGKRLEALTIRVSKYTQCFSVSKQGQVLAVFCT